MKSEVKYAMRMEVQQKISDKTCIGICSLENASFGRNKWLMKEGVCFNFGLQFGWVFCGFGFFFSLL